MLQRTAASGDGPPRMSRARKAEATRRSLIDAAAKVVGDEGYANASVAKITALADVAQGTFYNYFSSQQDLFDQLLPELGAELLDYIRERVAHEADSFRREEIGFRAFFEFVRVRPEFYRILNEAETVSPKAFEAHMANMADGYMRALRTSAAKGELAGFADRELEVVVYTLLAARNYLWFRFMRHAQPTQPVPEWVVDAYMRLLETGIKPTSSRAGRQNARQKAPACAQPPGPKRYVASDAGIDMDVGAGDLDTSGNVGRAAILALLEATCRSLVAGAELISLTANFPASSAAARLRCEGSVDLTGGHAIVTLVVKAVDRHDPRTIATAQALLRSSSGTTDAAPARPPKPRRRN